MHLGADMESEAAVGTTDIDVLRDSGHTMDEHTIISGLKKLNANLTFDPAGKLGYFHPEQQNRQGVWYNERHVCTLGRGAAIPEINVWRVVVLPNGQKRPGYISRPGWRHSFRELVKARIPGITWGNLCKVFNIDYKVYTGPVASEEVA